MLQLLEDFSVVHVFQVLVIVYIFIILKTEIGYLSGIVVDNVLSCRHASLIE